MDVKSITEEAVKACNPPTRYELAKRLRTNWGAVDGWMKGKREPRAKHLLEMLRMTQERGKRGRGATLAVLVAVLCGAITPTQDASAEVYVKADRSTHYTHWLIRKALKLAGNSYRRMISILLPGVPCGTHSTGFCVTT